jgi:hypothetical protein
MKTKKGEKHSARVNITDTCVLRSFTYIIEINVCLLQIQACPKVVYLVVYLYVNIITVRHKQ